MLYVILSCRMAAKQIQFMMICMFNIAPAIRRPQMPLMPIMPVFLFLLWLDSSVEVDKQLDLSLIFRQQNSKLFHI